jgi:hypothetical protein
MNRAIAPGPALAGVAVGVALAVSFSTTIAWAACDNKDRPATPTDLTITQGGPPGSFTLFWKNHQKRTGLTYFDIHVRGPNNQDLHKDVVGGAEQAITNGGVGNHKFSDVPAVSDYTISMKARTHAHTEGCVSLAESAALQFKGPLGGAPPPKGVFPGNVGR